VVVADARAAERYRGEHEPVDPGAGHVPGAVNLPTSGNLGPDGRLLDPAALRRQLEIVGATADTIHYCGSGVTACHNVFAQALATGTIGALYPCSFSDPSREVETDQN
jgi:thiosulfate/3-mercaptopyruvate sulfurtransferase